MNSVFLNAVMNQPAEPIYRIAFIGDSTTEWGFIPRFVADGFAGIISDAENVVGDGIAALYDDSTLSWTAAGDTTGARESFEYDRKHWYESGTANKGNSIIIPAAFAPFGTPEGTPLPITMLANDGMGGRDQAPYVLGMILNGQRFVMVSNQGAAGQTAQNILARFPDVITKDTFGRPLSQKPTYIVILAGINNPVEEIEIVKDCYADMRDLCLAAGIKPIFGNLVMESPTVPDAAFIAEANAYLASIAVPNSVYVVDYYTACNGVAGAMSGPHFTTLGSKLAGAALADLLVSIAGQGVSRFALGRAANNLATNGELAGTSGSLTGMTGAAAVDSTFTGAGTCVASKESIEDQNDKQAYTITGASAGDELLVEFDPLWAVGQRVFGSIDVWVTGDGVSSADCVMEFKNADDSRIELIQALNPLSNHAMGELYGIFKTPTIAVPSYYDSGRFYFKAILSAGDSVIKIQNAGVMAV